MEGAFADACSACSSPVGYSSHTQSVINAQLADHKSMHKGRLTTEGLRTKSSPTRGSFADVVHGSIALASSLSISASGPSHDFRPVNLGNLVPVSLAPANTPMSPAPAAADRPWRNNMLNAPHSPVVAPALQLFTTPAAAAVANSARGAENPLNLQTQQIQRFVYIRPCDSACSEVSTATEMVYQMHTD